MLDKASDASEGDKSREDTTWEKNVKTDHSITDRKFRGSLLLLLDNSTKPGTENNWFNLWKF